MHQIVIPGLYLLAGIMAYATVHHFTIALSPPRQPVQVLFACMCLVAVPFAISLAQTFQSTNSSEFVVALKWNMAAILLFIALLPWFASLYSEKHPGPWLAGFSVLFAVLFVVNLTQPYSLQYDQFDGIRTLNLPWGETVTRGVGHNGSWGYVAVAGFLVLFGYVLHALCSVYLRHRRRADLWMLAAVALFLLCGSEGILVRLSIIDFIELGPVGVLAMTIVMSVALTHSTQTRLRDSERHFRMLFENLPIGMVAIDPQNGRIVEANQSALKLTGYNAEEFLSMNVDDLTLPDELAESRSRYEQLSRGLADHIYYEKRYLKKDGSSFLGYSSISTLKNDKGQVMRLIGSTIDITERKAAEERIHQLAFYDHLTELPNRRLLTDRLQRALASGARRGQYGALLFIDLDNFKTLNDTLGHVTGDLLLQQVAQRLVSCVREEDSVARFGGDEFVVILENLSEDALEAAAQTENVGAKILAALNQIYHLAAHEYHCTTSIGATLFNGTQQTTDELLKQADIAMYQSKKVGRNILRFFDPLMQDTINARAALERKLHKALENRQFHLHYQIQVDSSGIPIGAEALIRWTPPESGLVSPAQFIPLAEDTGLILPIGEWVLETVCAQLKAWDNNKLTRKLVLSVNISAKQFLQADFTARTRVVMQRYAIKPELLELELTESMLLENIEDTISTMETLRKIGVRFSLDDFGSGYSSLQYLKRLPLDQLKIDQSFVRDITFDSSDRAIVSTIIAMAKSLELEVIAEGVETEEQRDYLLNKGCTHYQGYLFSKPVPIEQFEALLKPV